LQSSEALGGYDLFLANLNVSLTGSYSGEFHQHGVDRLSQRLAMGLSLKYGNSAKYYDYFEISL
jgi:hypothetical protein